MEEIPLKLKVDMSPEAIDMRLRRLGQLYKLGKSLQKARPKGKVSDLRGGYENSVSPKQTDESSEK